MAAELIRANSKADCKLIAALAREIYTEHYTPIVGKAMVDYMLETLQSEEAVSRQIEEGKQYYIINLAGVPAGYFGVELKSDEGELFLSKLYIRRSARGNRLSSLAFDKMKYIAKDNGLKNIKLKVNKNNGMSMDIYKALGLEVTGTDISDIGNGFIMDDYVMEMAVI